MQSGLGLFDHSLSRENVKIEEYKKIKKLFIDCLNATRNKCILLCKNKYDQERNYSVSSHPEIEKNYKQIEFSKNIMLQDLSDIEEEANSENKLEKMKAFITDLTQLQFNSLFMQILIGKVKKYLLPTIKSENNKIELSSPRLDKSC